MLGLPLKTIPSAFRLDCNKNVSHSHSSPFLLRTQVSAADYLVTSLGVSSESLLRIGKHIDLKSTSKVDSVIALFLQFGFTNSDIARIFSNRPRLLSSDPHKTLKPKLQFLAQSGFSGLALAHLLTNDTLILSLSLENKLAPCSRFLTAFFGTKHAVLSLFSRRRGSWISRHYTENVPPNMETLRRYGVSDDDIVRLLLIGPSCVSLDPEAFEESVREVKEIGLDPRAKMFVRGVFALASMPKANREAKFELFRRFGWSEESVWALFVKNPMVFGLSVERLEASLGIFKERLNWESLELIRYPRLLMYSIEERILPRLAVVDALISKDLPKRPLNWNYVISLPEEKFFNRVVNPHRDEVPEVLELYHKKKKK